MGDGRPCAALYSEETGAHAPVFFRPYSGRTRNFTMWKIFLPRKKSCCVAQRTLLQQGKSTFLNAEQHRQAIDLKQLKIHNNAHDMHLLRAP
jgi:hypothetical protein